MPMASAMAKQLAQTEGAATGLLQDLSYELTGTQNRISTETLRLREAQAGHLQSVSTVRGKMAVQLGLAPGP